MNFRDFHKRTGATSILDDRLLLKLAADEFKEYSRFPRVTLPEPRIIPTSLSTLLSTRRSADVFGAHAPLPLTILSDIVHAGAGLVHTDSRIRRHHPSGGALYPLEYYLIPYRVASLEKKCYHYAPRSHALELLISSPACPAISDIFYEPNPTLNPDAILLITSCWGRVYSKYGEFAYRLALLEAGHSAQNMLLAATGLGIPARPIAGLCNEKIIKLLNLTEHIEDPLYALAIGS